MKVLITGGSGFLGAWIIRRLLKAGQEVRVLDLNADRRTVRQIVGVAADALEWQIGDISDGAQVMAAATGCDRIIHLAGVLTPMCQANPVRGAQINLIGTLNVFEAARALGMPSVVYASSAGVFGPDDGQHPLPATHYGTFKLASEGSARAYWNDTGLPSIGFRPFVVYGPGREGGLSAGPSLACRAAARDQAYTVPFTGASGLVYVDDVAAAFEKALMTPAVGARVFNLIGEVATIDEVMAAIRRVAPQAVLDAAGPPLPISADISEAGLEDLMGSWQRTSLADGVAATVAHYRDPAH